jgi:signal transduction histidine kinase
VVLGGLYAIGALLPFWYLSSPEAGSAFFPAAGLTLALLTLSPRQTWPLWLAVVAATEIIVDVTHGQSVGMALGFALANTIEPIVGATGLRWAARRRRSTLRDQLAIYLVYGVVAGPVVGALIGATVSSVVGGASGWASIAGKWFLGDALGVLVVATPILAWSRPSRFETRATGLETAAIVLLASGITIVPAVLWHHPFLYAVLPVLMWAALRGGWRAVSATGVGVAFTADWAAVTGHADELLAAHGSNQLVFVQLFIAVTLLAALMLAVEVADRKRAELVTRNAQAARDRSALEAEQAAEEERRRIVRETHDIVGHAMNVMLLNAGAARRLLSRDVDTSRRLLESVETVGRAAFRDLDMALGLLDQPGGLLTAPGLASVPSLIDVMAQAGMDVSFDGDGYRERWVSTLVDRSAYRIIQEALTNVATHAPRARTRVTVRLEPDAVFLSIVNDGASGKSGTGHEGGRGLIGMRERVAVLGGQIEIGPDEDGGFGVRARLPTLDGRR